MTKLFNLLWIVLIGTCLIPSGLIQAEEPGEVAEQSAEEVVKTLFVAILTNDKDTIEKLILPETNAQVLWQGPLPPKAAIPMIKAQFQTMTCRECQVGEILVLPDGLKLKVTDEMVNKNRKQLIPVIGGQPMPIPVSVVRVNDEWKVDVGPIIAARLAAHSVEEPTTNKNIWDKNYLAVSVDDDKQVGTYDHKVVTRNNGKEIEIVESFTLDYRGMKASMSSTVTYKTEPKLVAVGGTTETKIDGKTCMTGSVTLHGKTIDIQGKGFLNKRTKAAIVPPKVFGRKDWALPKGVVIFQSALPVVGPRLLPKEGELKDVVLAEFPDDIGAPELITLKEGTRLVRGAADAQGEYDLELFSKEDVERSFAKYRMNKDDQVISAVLFWKLKLVEIEAKPKEVEEEEPEE